MTSALPRPSRPSRGGRRLAIAAASVGLASAAAVAVALALPAWVKGRFIDACAGEGVTASVDDVGLTFTAIHLRGVRFTSGALPQVRVTGRELTVTLDGFTPTNATLDGADVLVDGAIDDVRAAVAAFAAAQKGGTASPDGPAPSGGGSAESMATLASITVTGGHVMWKRILGAATELEASGVSGKAQLAPAAAVAYSGQTTAMTLAGIASGLGPWRGSFEGTSRSQTLRVFLDPKQTAAQVTVVAAGATTDVDVKIARTKIATLGIPPMLVALPPSGTTEVQVALKAKLTGEEQLDGDVDVSLFGMHLAGAPAPLDVRLVGAVAGDPAKPLAFKNGALYLGPVAAAVNGTLTPVWTARGTGKDLVGTRADLAFRAGPIPCATLAKQALATVVPAGGLAGDLARQLGGMAAGAAEQAGRALGLTTTLTASGTITFDSRDPTRTEATVKSANACGLTIFASP